MSDETTSRRLTGLTGVSYFVAFLLIVLSLFDFAGTIWPFLPSDAGWRYGSVGILSGFLLTPMIGSLLAVYVAAFAGQGRVLRVLGIVDLVVAVVLVVGVGSFALDSLQVRSDTNPEARRLLETGAVKVMVKHLAGIVAFGWLGVTALKVGKRTRGIERADAGASLLVGRK